jgi:hypothetical protein
MLVRAGNERAATAVDDQFGVAWNQFDGFNEEINTFGLGTGSGQGGMRDMAAFGKTRRN